MDDLRAHYLVMVGEVCAQAHSATLSVIVTVRGGATYTGVPQPREAGPSDPDQIDSTGFSEELTIGDTGICLADVVDISISSP